ncbi:MAG: DUF4157 domain-containing protein [Chloroflexota bacterium]
MPRTVLAMASPLVETTQAHPGHLVEASPALPGHPAEATQPLYRHLEGLPQALPRHLQEVTQIIPSRLEEATQALPRHLEGTAQAISAHLNEAVQVTPTHLEGTTQALPRHLAETSQAFPRQLEGATQAIQRRPQGAIQGTPRRLAEATQALPRHLEGVTRALPRRLIEATQALPRRPAEATWAFPRHLEEATQVIQKRLKGITQALPGHLAEATQDIQRRAEGATQATPGRLAEETQAIPRRLHETAHAFPRQLRLPLGILARTTRILSEESTSIRVAGTLGGEPSGLRLGGIFRRVESPTMGIALATMAHSQGEPLEGEVRREMEAILMSKLEGIRLHRDTAAGRAATLLQAEAFTVGKDVFFAPGRFAPTTPQGQALLGHELTHVAQQLSGRAGGGFDLENSARGREPEREALATEATMLVWQQPPPAMDLAARGAGGSTHRLLEGSSLPMTPISESGQQTPRVGVALAPQDRSPAGEAAPGNATARITQVSAAGAPLAGGATPPPDLEALAAQVYNLLKARLLVERERYGWQRADNR